MDGLRSWFQIGNLVSLEPIRLSQVGVRALFAADWDVNKPKRPFEQRAVMTKEVRALRAEHNFAPETAIRDVATALRRNLDEAAFDRVLATFPRGATEFWQL